MKHTPIAVGMLAVVLSAVPAVAAPQDTSSSLARWVDSANRQIDRVMVMPASNSTGMATVSFRRGEDGRPTDIIVAKGNRALHAAARQSILRLRNLQALPVGYDPNTRITLHLLIGDPGDVEKYNRDNKIMLADASTRNNRLAPVQMAALEPSR